MLGIQGCKWGSYSYNCNETCQTVCANNGTCDVITGTCEQVNHKICLEIFLYAINYYLIFNIFSLYPLPFYEHK